MAAATSATTTWCSSGLAARRTSQTITSIVIVRSPGISSRTRPRGVVVNTKQAAADALMDALEDWARSLGEAGVRRSDGARYFPSRQIDRSMRRAHKEGRLFEELTGWLPSYRGLRTKPGGDAYANRMRDIVEHGCPLWESVVAEIGRPWTPFITPEQRQILHRVVADVHDEIARGERLKADLRLDLQARGVRDVS